MRSTSRARPIVASLVEVKARWRWYWCRHRCWHARDANATPKWAVAGHVIWVEIAQARVRPVVAILVEVKAGLAAIDSVGEVIASINRRLFTRRDDLKGIIVRLLGTGRVPQLYRSCYNLQGRCRPSRNVAIILLIATITLSK